MTDQITQAIASKQWILVSAIVIGLVMRTLRNPNLPFFSRMSSQMHGVIIVLAGAIAAAADAVVNGLPWGTALLQAGVSTAIAGVALMQPPMGQLPPPPPMPQDFISTIPAPGAKNDPSDS